MAKYVLVRWLDASVDLDLDLDPARPGPIEPCLLETGGWLISDDPDHIRIGMDRGVLDSRVRGIYQIPRVLVQRVTVLGDFPDAKTPPKRSRKPAKDT